MPELGKKKKHIQEKLQALLVHSLAAGSIKENDVEHAFRVKFSWGNILDIYRKYAEIKEAPAEYLKGQNQISLLKENKILYSTHVALIAFFESYGIPVEVSTLSQVMKEGDGVFPPNPLSAYEFDIYPTEDFDHQNLYKVAAICKRLNSAIQR